MPKVQMEIISKRKLGNLNFVTWKNPEGRESYSIGRGIRDQETGEWSNQNVFLSYDELYLIYGWMDNEIERVEKLQHV